MLAAMTLTTAMILGSLCSLAFMAAGMVWLGRRGKFEKTAMSCDEAGHFVTRGVFGRGAGKTWFRGKAVGASWGAEISTFEVLQMLHQGRWHEAMPWLVAIIGTLSAFFFWPMLVLLLCGADAWTSLAFTAFFVVSAVRAAWPRQH
jgi:hypothetical protein